MDILAWVRALRAQLEAEGDLDLAAQIAELPCLVIDGDHDRVDAMAPGMLAAAQAGGLEWLAVYVRHWHLQSRVAKRGEGRAALGEAVDAVERAHRDGVAGCPQAVCSIQDLCMAYANVDRAGYTAERLAVTEEALAAIDPSWPCFTCITHERATALVDAGRSAEALRFLSVQRTHVGPNRSADDLFRRPLVYAALADGRPADALRAAKAAESRPDRSLGRAEVPRRRLDLAVALAACGDLDAAADFVPPAAAILPRDRPLYAELVAVLAASRTLDTDADTVALVHAWAASSVHSGAFDAALRLAAASVRLATAIGDDARADAALDTARRAADQLREPSRVGGLLSELSVLRKR